jgi:hypothetical protein
MIKLLGVCIGYINFKRMDSANECYFLLLYFCSVEILVITLKRLNNKVYKVDRLKIVILSLIRHD